MSLLADSNEVLRQGGAADGCTLIKRVSVGDRVDEDNKIIPLYMHPLGLVEAFLHHGACMEGLLSGTGISEASLQRKDMKISYAQQCQLIKNGIKACNLPGLGLRVGQQMDWCYSGSVGGAVYCSTSLAEAKAAFRRYFLIAQPQYRRLFSRLDCYRDRGNRLVTLIRTVADESIEPELARFELEYRLATTAKLYDLCGNKSVDGASVVVGLHYAEPTHAALYQALPCDVTFNCAQSYIAAPVPFLTERWRPLRAHLFDRLMQQCEAEFQVAEQGSTYAEKVYWCISTHFHSELSIEAVAGIIGFSARSLARRLALEQTSFRQIFNHVKMELVTLHLEFSSLQFDDIAELAGFSCSSSLRRAVRAWRRATRHTNDQVNK